MSHEHKNKHNHCEHCLHDCGPCDTAYCCKCPKAWANCHQTHYSGWPIGGWPYYYDPTPILATTISAGTGGAGSVTNDTQLVHDHGHAR